MGPASDTHKLHSMADPPRYEPKKDSVNLVKASTETGEGSTFKTFYSTLGQSYVKQAIRDPEVRGEESQSKLHIDFKKDDQVKAVVEIVELLVVDPPIAVVLQLIISFNKLSTCQRGKHKYHWTFVSHFREIAAELIRPSVVGNSA